MDAPGFVSQACLGLPLSLDDCQEASWWQAPCPQAKYLHIPGAYARSCFAMLPEEEGRHVSALNAWTVLCQQICRQNALDQAFQDYGLCPLSLSREECLAKTKDCASALSRPRNPHPSVPMPTSVPVPRLAPPPSCSTTSSRFAGWTVRWRLTKHPRYVYPPAIIAEPHCRTAALPQLRPGPQRRPPRWEEDGFPG